MKIAVTATGATPESDVDPRFGRAKYFIIYDIDNGTWVSKDNTVNLNAVQGAGIQSAKNIIDAEAQAVITGNVGPKAFMVLQKAAIPMYTGAKGTVRDAIAAFSGGSLNSVDRATVEGHWS